MIRPPTGLAGHGIDKSFGRRRVLANAELEVTSGEVVALVGENGAGKSTLLRICAGLLRPDAGKVRLRGRLGHCPQATGLFDLLTPAEHLVLFGAARGLPPSEALAAGEALLGELHFRGALGLRVRELSEGSRQKLSLVLALLGDPEVLLLDEPYQGFDHGSYVSFWDQVAHWREGGRAVVVVTHLLAERALVDRVVELAAPDGDRGRSPA